MSQKCISLLPHCAFLDWKITRIDWWLWPKKVIGREGFKAKPKWRECQSLIDRGKHLDYWCGGGWMWGGVCVCVGDQWISNWVTETCLGVSLFDRWASYQQTVIRKWTSNKICPQEMIEVLLQVNWIILRSCFFPPLLPPPCLSSVSVKMFPKITGTSLSLVSSNGLKTRPTTTSVKIRYCASIIIINCLNFIKKG